MAKQQASQRFGKCLVEREIGRGARSIVYLAWHEGLQIPVAVKVMMRSKAEDDELFSERFMREARIAAQLTHTNIVRVYDCGETDESYYLVLEYIEGESCKERMTRAGVFDWQGAVRIIRSVADGLRYASTKGIIHRDLKPENIMIDTEGAARIADLGLAKDVTMSQASATADGDVLGTPYYMSPEQVRQPGDVDFRSDIYSLGATLYHMVTGEVPFEAPTPFEIMTLHLNEAVPHPRTKKPDLNGALCEIIMRMMAKEPQSRYQSYADLIRDLDGLFVKSGRAPIEDLDEEPDLDRPVAERRAAADQETEVEPKLVSRVPPRDLPATPHNVRAKAFGLLSVIGYAFFIVCLYLIVLPLAGGVAAAACTLLVAGGSGAWGFWLARRQGLSRTDEEAAAVDERLGTTLSRLCERLSLPVPRVTLSGRADPECHAYGLLSGKGIVRLPGAWLERAQLDEAETEALLAQNLAGIYNGDADIRTLIAVPVTILSLGSRAIRALLAIPSVTSPRARIFIEGLAVVTGMGVMAALLAALFLLWVPAGLLGVLFLALLVLVAAFERQSLCAADEFAVKLLGDDGPVQSLIAICGLTSWERCRLLYETIGPDVARRAMKSLPSPEERRHLVESIASHYERAAFVPDTLALARSLFSRLPLTGERLGRLSAVGEGRSPVRTIVRGIGRVFARLLGTADDGAPITMAELAAVRPQVLMGTIAGVLAVPILALIVLIYAQRYGPFLVVLGVLAAVLGVLVAHQTCREGLSAVRLGWGTIVASSFFTATTMVGFCLTGMQSFAPLAVQFPLTLVPVTLVAGLSGALFARWGPKPPPAAGGDAGSRTAHTLTMPLEGRGSILRSRNRRNEDAARRAEED